MDQPTSIAAVVIGVAAGVIATAEAPVSRVAEAAATPVAATASAPASASDNARAACLRATPNRNVAPPTPTIGGAPPDRQFNTSGTDAAVIGGDRPDQVRSDPCEPVRLHGPLGARAASAASAAASPTVAPRR